MEIGKLNIKNTFRKGGNENYYMTPNAARTELNVSVTLCLAKKRMGGAILYSRHSKHTIAYKLLKKIIWYVN